MEIKYRTERVDVNIAPVRHTESGVPNTASWREVLEDIFSREFLGLSTNRQVSGHAKALQYRIRKLY